MRHHREPDGKYQHRAVEQILDEERRAELDRTGRRRRSRDDARRLAAMRNVRQKALALFSMLAMIVPLAAMQPGRNGTYVRTKCPAAGTGTTW
jgi:hypothetical protein